METSSIIILVVSGVISFALGRILVHMRNIKRKERAQAREAQALRDQPAPPESKNRRKRKRQLRQSERDNASQKR